MFAWEQKEGMGSGIECRQFERWKLALGTASTLVLASVLLLPGFAQSQNSVDKARMMRQKQDSSMLRRQDNSDNYSNYNRGINLSPYNMASPMPRSASTPVRGALMPASTINAASSVHTYATKGARRSDAVAGVELLESIFNRVMNIPQVALTKSTTTQIVAQNLKQNSQAGGVDYKLAIRPKEQGKVFAAPSPSLQIAQAPSAPSAPSIAAGLSAGLNSNAAPGNFGMRQQLALLPPSVQKPSFMQHQSQSESAFGDEGGAAQSTEVWRGGSLARAGLKNEGDDRPGVWEDAAPPSSSSFGAQQGLSLPHARTSLPSTSTAMPSAGPSSGVSLAHGGFGDFAAGGAGAGYGYVGSNSRAGSPAGFDSVSEKKKAPDLSTSVNRLYKLSKRLEEAQNLQERADKAQQQAESARVRVAQANRQKASWYNSPRQVDILDERPIVKDFREAPGVADAEAQLELAPSPARRAKTSTISGQLMNKAELRPAKAELKAAESKERERDYDSLVKTSSAKDKLALLPPNVVTGIPLGNVTLGKSEAQVIASLAQIGKLKQYKIKNWTVYSWSKKLGDGSDALQLYFRHGMLDAIRIFDSGLVGTDFGVSPGDRLEEVKERFGEPAFLLAEPGSVTAGKNYIYPISQVAFQLARTSESSPQVVSVLIFSVK